MTPIPFVKNDGGRRDSGFRGNAGDCVARAVAIASGMPYKDVYNSLAHGNKNQRKTKNMQKSGLGKKSARHGIYTKRKWFKDYMKSLGFRWVATSGIGIESAKCCSEDIPDGNIIIAKRRHYAAVINGVLNDTYNSTEPRYYTGIENGNEYRRLTFTNLYGYWIKDERCKIYE